MPLKDTQTVDKDLLGPIRPPHDLFGDIALISGIDKAIIEPGTTLPRASGFDAFGNPSHLGSAVQTSGTRTLAPDPSTPGPGPYFTPAPAARGTFGTNASPPAWHGAWPAGGGSGVGDGGITNISNINNQNLSSQTSNFFAGGGTPAIGGAMAMFGGAIQVAPRLVIAIRAAANATNAGRFAGIVGAGRGLLARLIPALGLEAIADLFGFGISDLFGASEIQQLEELVEELVDSGYIQWDARTDRHGQQIAMTFVVIPLDNDERPYGMSYRPFSRSTVNKMQTATNTIKRRRTPRRRAS